MAGFCAHCGSALGEGLRFCPGCGTQLQGPASGAPAPVTPSTPVTNSATGGQPTSAASTAAPGTGKSSTSLAAKIVLGVVAVFATLTILGMATCFYVGYRVKKKAEEINRVYKNSGLDKVMNEAGTPHPATSAPPPITPSRDACTLVSKDAVAAAMGVPIAAAVKSTNTQNASGTLWLSMFSSHANVSGCEYGRGRDVNPRATVTVLWNSGTYLLGTMKLMAQGAGQAHDMEPVSGLGDEAFVLRGSGILARRNETYVGVTTHGARNELEAEKVILREALSSL